MAQKAGLRLLGSLPLDPEVVRKGDAGDMQGLVDVQIPFVQEFNKLVGEVEKLTNAEAIEPVTKEDNIKESRVYLPASFFKASALSVFSQVKSGSSLPKWP